MALMIIFKHPLHWENILRKTAPFGRQQGRYILCLFKFFAFSIIALLLANIVIPNRERTWVKVLNVVLGIVVVASAVAVIAGFFVDVEAVLGNLLSDMGFVTPADAAQRIVDSVMDGI